MHQIFAAPVCYATARTGRGETTRRQPIADTRATDSQKGSPGSAPARAPTRSGPLRAASGRPGRCPPRSDQILPDAQDVDEGPGVSDAVRVEEPRAVVQPQSAPTLQPRLVLDSAHVAALPVGVSSSFSNAQRCRTEIRRLPWPATIASDPRRTPSVCGDTGTQGSGMNSTSMEAAARTGTGPRFRILVGPLGRLRRLGARLGPSVLLELLLPGGTVFALLLFLYQRWKPDAGSRPAQIGLASPPWVVSSLGQGVLAVVAVPLADRLLLACAVGYRHRVLRQVGLLAGPSWADASILWPAGADALRVGAGSCCRRSSSTTSPRARLQPLS